MNKSIVTCQVYTDNKLTKSILEKKGNIYRQKRKIYKKHGKQILPE